MNLQSELRRLRVELGIDVHFGGMATVISHEAPQRKMHAIRLSGRYAEHPIFIIPIQYDDEGCVAELPTLWIVH